MRSGPTFFSRCGILMAGLALAVSAQATTYKWKDPKTGRIVLSDQPPPAGVQEIGKRPSRAGGPTDPSNLPLATRQAMAEFPVTMFTADDCLEACADARGLLNGRGVPFTELNIRDGAARNRLEALGEVRLPTMLVGRQAMRGFQADDWNNTLNLAGYPQAAPLGYRAPPAPTPAASAEPEAPVAEPEDLRATY